MKYKLFYKELFGSKTKVIIFAVISLLMYSLIGIQVLLSTQNSTSTITPDLEFYGTQYGEAILFDKYNPIDSNFKQFLTEKGEDSFECYDVIERNIITVRKENSLENITYRLISFDYKFIKNKLEKELLYGNIPTENENEILVGAYIAKAFDFKIGESTSKKTASLKGLGAVDIYFDLSGNFKEMDYRVSGILNATNDILDYCVIIPYETQPNITPNSEWVYFTSDNSEQIYKESLVQDNTNFFSEYSLGGVAENFQNNNNGIVNLLLNISYIFLLVIVLSYLIISYIVKGINRKLGILKALGLSDGYIFKCYLLGIIIIQLFSLFLSILLSYFLCIGLNGFISDSYGYDVNIYRIEISFFIVLIMMFIIVILSMWSILRYKITKISPKVAMEN
ncbi:MAG: ABC transporter permease [Oscillospiraceae bacterium]|nr:ABC transporter permease [Oscillospiraceae bacterium]